MDSEEIILTPEEAVKLIKEQAEQIQLLQKLLSESIALNQETVNSWKESNEEMGKVLKKDPDNGF